MASCLRLMLKCLSFFGMVLTFLYILDIFSMIFAMDPDPVKDWKFLALLTLVVCALTLWGTDTKNPQVLAYAIATSLITLTLYYTIEMDDILVEFGELTGLELFKAIGLRSLVLLAVTIVLSMMACYRMGVLHEHVLLLHGKVTVKDDAPNPNGRPHPPKTQTAPSNTTSSKTSESRSTKSKSSVGKIKISPKEPRNVQPGDDESEGDWDDEDGEEEEEDEFPSDVHQSAKSFSSQFLERPSSRITGSSANSASVSSKPSPTTIVTDGVPTKSSN